MPLADFGAPFDNDIPELRTQGMSGKWLWHGPGQQRLWEAASHPTWSPHSGFLLTGALDETHQPSSLSPFAREMRRSDGLTSVAAPDAPRRCCTDVSFNE